MNLSYKLCNIVYMAKLSTAIKRAHVLLLPHTKLCGRNSSVHVKLSNRSLVVQKSGNILIFKTKTLDEANDALNNFTMLMRNNNHPVIVLKRPVVCYMVGTTALGYKLNLDVLSGMICCEYEADLHPSIFVQLSTSMKATLTHTPERLSFLEHDVSKTLRMVCVK